MFCVDAQSGDGPANRKDFKMSKTPDMTAMFKDAMTSFAEIAKKAQADTLEMITAADKDLSEEATSAAKASSGDASSDAK